MNSYKKSTWKIECYSVGELGTKARGAFGFFDTDGCVARFLNISLVTRGFYPPPSLSLSLSLFFALILLISCDWQSSKAPDYSPKPPPPPLASLRQMVLSGAKDWFFRFRLARTMEQLPLRSTCYETIAPCLTIYELCHTTVDRDHFIQLLYNIKTFFSLFYVI